MFKALVKQQRQSGLRHENKLADSRALAKLLEECRIDVPGPRSVLCLGQQSDPVSLSLNPALRLRPIRLVPILQVHFDPARRLREPLVESAVQHEIVEERREKRWSESQSKRAEQQPRTNARALAVLLPVHVELYARAEQHESERKRQNEDEDRDGG